MSFRNTLKDGIAPHSMPPLTAPGKVEQMKRYDLRAIMYRAWRLFRKLSLSFAECLHRAWITAKAAELNSQRIADAKAAAGITEECNTWAGWKAEGYEVIHGSKALFGVNLIWGSRGDDAIYKARFFGASQVQPAAD